MRQEKYIYQVGDVLYEASKTYGRVIEHKIISIHVEEYLSDTKTIFKLSTSDFGGGEVVFTKFCSDVLEYFDTREEAEHALQEIKE